MVRQNLAYPPILRTLHLWSQEKRDESEGDFPAIEPDSGYLMGCHLQTGFSFTLHPAKPPQNKEKPVISDWSDVFLGLFPDEGI